MNCKDCTCYVDRYSTDSTKVPSGQGLCTMHDKDVLADENCKAYLSANIYQNESEWTADVTTQGNEIPRRGMKNAATVFFVLAVIYAVGGIAFHERIMFDMTVFCSVFGVMFRVLSQSPKQNPYLLGRQIGLRKTPFVIICVTIAFCSLVLIDGTMIDAEQPAAADAANLISAACAGRNATATTESKAIRVGFGRCKKCG